jgi:hypothetical protein
MGKKSVILISVLILVMLVSCATTGARDGFSEIVITRDDDYGSYNYYWSFQEWVKIRVFLDGKNVGTITENKNKIYRVPNGTHEVYIESKDTSYGLYDWESSSRSREKMILNNERIYLIGSAGGTGSNSPPTLHIGERVTLWTVEKKLNLQSLTNAINKSFVAIEPLLQNKSKIAVTNIVCSDSNISERLIDELNQLFVKTQKYVVVERKALDVIRNELAFQMSDEVDDDTFVGVGKFIGAGILITGTIKDNRLLLKALDARTAQIMAMAIETF